MTVIQPCSCIFPVQNYCLDLTFSSGQVFHWEKVAGGWEGVAQGRWVRLMETDRGISAETVVPVNDWRWLADFLQVEAAFETIVKSFPPDPELIKAVTACRGLRLLQQDPWECLACFILSANKQIIQIRQIVAALCERYGESVAVPEGHPPVHAFPSAKALSEREESDLRACKMGFRAPNLLKTARLVASGELALEPLRRMSLDQARVEMLKFPGVGPKIADCVLLFALGFGDAFPIDVWIARILKEHYFPRREIGKNALREFTRTHFGPYGGYAQQYLFHYVRTKT